jgi:hypothetical protein
MKIRLRMRGGHAVKIALTRRALKAGQSFSGALYFFSARSISALS